RGAPAGALGAAARGAVHPAHGPRGRGVRLAHPGAALRVELAKLGQQLTIRALLAVCLLGPVAFALVMRVQSTVPADTLFGRWARTTGSATSLTVLSFATTFGLPLVAGVLAGDVFSSEDRH